MVMTKPKSLRITALRLYKPDGGMLEFVLGSTEDEGEIKEITVNADIGEKTFYCVKYASGVTAEFEGFPAAVKKEMYESTGTSE